MRIIISDGSSVLLNAQQIKMVSLEACLCHVFEDRPGKAGMCAYVRTLITSWEVLRAVDQTPAVAQHF